MRLGMIAGYTREEFGYVKDLGLDFVEICCNSAEESKSFVSAQKEVKKLLEIFPLDISSVGRWSHSVNNAGVLDSHELCIYYSLLDTAITLGAKTFVCGINRDDSISLYKNYTAAIKFFSELIRRADGKIKIAVQNCDWQNFVISPEQWRVILGELPELMLKYDCSHALNRDCDYIAEIAEFGERIAHVHIKGTVKTRLSSPFLSPPTGLHGADWAGMSSLLCKKGYAGIISPRVGKPIADPPAGLDEIAWPSVFAALYSAGYNGDLSIEPHSAVWKKDSRLGKEGLKFTINYIKNFIF